MKSVKPIIGSIALIVFAVGAGFIIVKSGNKSNDNPSTDSTQTIVPVATPVATEETTEPATTVSSSSPYTDGTYSATGSYDSPAGTESILVSVTLKNGIIETANVTSEATDGTSRRYQNMFISGYQSYVVGKNIADVNLSRVSGSSLTPIGFNQALSTIKSEAAA